ncbi:uncharacterized protein LOC121481023 [Vulpes lagopus]|uniref:uncharacterized protein LOC121481023 n=1 Tax=Vulpes lagopus TaxID=494514 RepID=UPI001BCA0462|nr:uncharacterized protein LOC121481023 [Vulpes lagopus]
MAAAASGPGSGSGRRRRRYRALRAIGSVAIALPPAQGAGPGRGGRGSRAQDAARPQLRSRAGAFSPAPHWARGTAAGPPASAAGLGLLLAGLRSRHEREDGGVASGAGGGQVARAAACGTCAAAGALAVLSGCGFSWPLCSGTHSRVRPSPRRGPCCPRSRRRPGNRASRPGGRAASRPDPAAPPPPWHLRTPLPPGPRLRGPGRRASSREAPAGGRLLRNPQLLLRFFGFFWVCFFFLFFFFFAKNGNPPDFFFSRLGRVVTDTLCFPALGFIAPRRYCGLVGVFWFLGFLFCFVLFLQIEGCGDPVSSRLFSALFPTAFVHLGSESRFGHSYNISNFPINFFPPLLSLHWLR